MSFVIIPKNYRNVLSVYETQSAIGILRRIFETELSSALNLKRVTAPLFVEGSTGLNDDLNGVERAVEFDIPATGTSAQIVHSLAKWKRVALHNYGFSAGEGIYTDMNAVRRDEEMDNVHSIYVDQWDWEKVMWECDRNETYLKETVQSIVSAICRAHREIKRQYPALTLELTEKVTFITSQELEDMYPHLTPKQREDEITRKHRTVFIMQIGDILKSGQKHDGRAPDYDDWTLNGDLLFWDDILDRALEISSMGIRVNAAALADQLKKAGAEDRRQLFFHRMLLDGTLPQTIGGGIGQSRLCMLLLEKAHVGEVQVSVWDKDTVDICSKNGIVLL